VFSSSRGGHTDLYRKPANGTGAEELLYGGEGERYPVSWSPDGKILLSPAGLAPSGDLWVLPLTQEHPGEALKAQGFLQTEFGESFGQFSPDGRWVAYESAASGQAEIYVVPFSRPSEKHQISPSGGARPRWRKDGKEIFFVSPNASTFSTLMAAEIRITGDSVEVGSVRKLFSGIPASGGYLYDVSADGQRILVAVPVSSQKPPEPITLVQNWPAALKN
jgi:Tol biopolymer transport system component